MVLHRNQSLHGIGRRRVHANLSIPVHRHKPERRVNHFIHHGKIQTVALGNSAPIMDPGTPQRINSQVELRPVDYIQVNDVAKIGNVDAEVVVPVRRGGIEGLR